jgi:hypothetical protein
VYDTANLTRLVVSNQTGIVPIGSLIAPSTPQVTVYENDTNPHYSISTTISNSGIVEAVEFWITSDVPPAVNQDSNRTYSLLTTAVPAVVGNTQATSFATVANSGSTSSNTFGSAGAFATTVTTTVNSQPSGNFLIKARTRNSQTASPFSAPGGFVYNPQQTAGAISNSTSIAGLAAGALGAAALLGALDNLFSGNAGPNTTSGQIVKSIGDVFTGNTSPGTFFDNLANLFTSNSVWGGGNTYSAITSIGLTDRAKSMGLSIIRGPSRGQILLDLNDIDNNSGNTGNTGGNSGNNTVGSYSYTDLNFDTSTPDGSWRAPSSITPDPATHGWPYTATCAASDFYPIYFSGQLDVQAVVATTGISSSTLANYTFQFYSANDNPAPTAGENTETALARFYEDGNWPQSFDTGAVFLQRAGTVVGSKGNDAGAYPIRLRIWNGADSTHTKIYDSVFITLTVT